MQAPADRLALLYRLSQTLTSTLNLDEVLNRVMDEVITALRAERGFLMLHDDTGCLAFRVARGMDRHTIYAPAFQVSRGVVERVAAEGRPLLTSDAQQDAWLGGRASIVGLRLHSILCVPLLAKGANVGVIYLDNRLQAGIFTGDDLELLSAIAATAVIAIENARLYQVAVDKGRMERELQLARAVQASLIPTQMPQLAGYELAARWLPALEVSGDYYDFIATSSEGALTSLVRGPTLADAARAGSASAALPVPEPAIQSVVIADVSGKGMPAALFMALTRSVVRACLSQAPLAEAITRANQLICADSAEGLFVTLFCAQLDPAGGRLAYVNAGHNPPLVYRSREAVWLPLGRTGLLLGFDEDCVYAAREVELERGDCVVLYTDGATEATDPTGKEFGEERLQEVLAGVACAPACDMLAAVEAALSAHIAGSAPFDDITLCILRRT
jgi:phosphoserine phosphatase RsbU/P